MNREEASSFVKQQLADGKSDEDIRALLLRDGFGDIEINGWLREARGVAPASALPQQAADIKPTREPDLKMAAVGALCGAFAAAAVWAMVAWISEYELGFIAIGVGFLCGFLAVTFGGGTNFHVTLISVGASILSIATAKYIVMMLLLQKIFAGQDQVVINISWFSGDSFKAFRLFVVENPSFWDILFVAFAIYAAWKATSPKSEED